MQAVLKKLTPNLMVEDVNSTLDFYRETFDCKVLATVPEEGQFNWAMLQLADITLMVQARHNLADEIPYFQDVPMAASIALYIDMTGIDELYAKLKDTLTIVHDMTTTFYNTREFAVQDCNGYILHFAETIPK